MPRPPVKKTEKLAAAQAYGEMMGRQKALKKLKLPDVIKQKLLEALDRIDPLDLAGVLALTVTFKSALDASQEWTEHLASIHFDLGFAKYYPLAIFVGAPAPVNAPPDNELLEWLLAFSAAYLTIKFGPEIVGGIVGWAKAATGGIPA